MGKNGRSRIWWWIVLAVVILLGGLGYYWYARTGPESEKVLVAKEVTPDQKPDISEGVQGAGTRTGMEVGARTGKEVSSRTESGVRKQAGPEASVKEGSNVETFPIKKERPSPTSEMEAQGPIEELFVMSESESPARETAPVRETASDRKKAYCTLIEQQVSDFFQSLDTKRYFRQFKLKKDAYAYFTRIIKRLSARPPLPAGEGIHPATLVTNVYYFSRALDLKDLRVIKAIITNEHDTMEFNLETFYRWLMLGKECPNPGNVRPSFDVTYRYAGFFLNTTGGRAYLFRRSLRLRLLVSYYCVLIVYQADKLGKNSYGINIFPFIQPLRDEIEHHPEFEFQQNYLSVLNRIEEYYAQRR